LARLRVLGKLVVTTNDVSLSLGIERSAATHTLKRLAAANLIKKVRHGLWALDPTLDPLRLPEYLTAPFPSYVSFQSALFLRGMVSQVPAVIYVASLAPTRRIVTSFGSFSVHRLAPTFFGGFDTDTSGMRLATAEKALLDTLYLGPTRSRMFAHLPEIEIPDSFNRRKAREWIARIPAGPRRRSVELRLARLLDRGRKARRSRGSTSSGRRRSGRRGSRRQRPANRVRSLIGSLESGVPDLARRHRAYIRKSLQRRR
jgi:predicted transcriptional regulator of viral defense system